MEEDLYSRFSVLLGAALMVPTAVFSALAISNPDYRFWRYSAAGAAAIFVASIAGAMRDLLPEFAYALLANILVLLGYFWCVKSLRHIKEAFLNSGFDYALLLIFISAVCVNFFTLNTYESRVILVSVIIFSFSFILLSLSLRRGGRVSRLGDSVIAVFASLNMFFALMRGVAATHIITEEYLSFKVWDANFFIWSIAAVFAYAIGQFLNGNAIIVSNALATIQKLDNLLHSEKILSQKLSDTIIEQRNLQKLVMHEIKRPLNALSAAIQVSLSSPTGESITNMKRLRVLSLDASSSLESISQFDEISELFNEPTWSNLNLRNFSNDLNLKWDIKLECSAELSDLTLRADSLLLDIALGNLIENAIKFSNSPSEVSTNLFRENNYIVWDVCDSGKGIPISEQNNVWQKFYKIRRDAKNSANGSGLGLYVVKEVAGIHNGYAKVISQSPSIVRFAMPITAGDGAM
jgi:signal transduction histidine kinase